MQHLTRSDLREVINLGTLNYDSVKPEQQPELKRRIEAAEAELAKRERRSPRPFETNQKSSQKGSSKKW